MTLTLWAVVAKLYEEEVYGQNLVDCTPLMIYGCGAGRYHLSRLTKMGEDENSGRDASSDAAFLELCRQYGDRLEFKESLNLSTKWKNGPGTTSPTNRYA